MAASKFNRFLSMALVGLMLTPIVSFATNDTSSTEATAEETEVNNQTNTNTNTNTAGTTDTSDGGIKKAQTGIPFIDKISSNLPTDGFTQEDVDEALDYLIASSTERKAAAFEDASVKPAADTSLKSDGVFDSSKTIDGHMYVTESTDYELYVEPDTLSVIIRDKKSGTLIRSTVEDPDAYVRSSQQLAYGRITSGITLNPIKYNPDVASRSGMYDQGNVEAFSRDATITYDKKENGFVAHLNFDNHKNDVALSGLNIQFDLEVTLDDTGLKAVIPADTVKENYNKDKLCWLMGDVYIFPLMGFTDRGDTDGYMILPDGNGITVNFADFYQDGTAKYKSPFQARVYGSDISFDTVAATDADKEREDMNAVEEVIAPYFGMVHDYSSLNKDSDEKNIAVLGFVTKGAENCMINGSFNGVNSCFENYAYASAAYRMVYQQPVDNASGSSKTEMTDQLIGDYEVTFLFASGDEANYSGLAKKCREMLLANGTISQSADTEYDVRIDVLGLDKENFLLFRRNVVATTIENVQEILTQLKNEGVLNISLYFDGWQKDGMYNLPNTDYKVDNDLGGNSGMKELLDAYANSSISISLLQNMLEINDTTTNSTFTAVKMVNKRTYSSTDRFLNVYKTFKYLTPSKTNEYIKTFANNISDGGFKNVAFTGFTDTLFAYSLNNTIHSRQDAMDYYTSALSEVKNKGMTVALDSPSMYLWKYTDEYLNMPISSSMYVYTSEEIPFLSSVLKGSMKIYSEYVNYEANQTEFFLKLVETGVYPSFLLTYESPTVLQYTNSSWDYSSAYKQYLEVIKELNDDLEEVNAQTRGAYIDKHEVNYDGITNLTKVTYSNGVIVYVNYSEKTVSADGTTIDGLSYKVR